MPEVRRFEPRLALDGGADGLDAYRAIAAGRPGLLAAGGHLLVEIGHRQAPEIAETFRASGWLRREAPGRIWADIERVVAAADIKGLATQWN